MVTAPVVLMAHARRYFFELHANHQSQIAGHALHYIAQLYEIEREVKSLRADERQRIRQADCRRRFAFSCRPRTDRSRYRTMNRR